ncbi:MAG: ATP-binding protein [Limisphaerales bacterium]
MSESGGATEESIHVLLVEDNPADAQLIRLMLEESTELPFVFTNAESLTQAFQRIADNVYDIVLLDLTLPDTHGLETFSAVYSRIPDTPIIVMSGLDDENMAIRTVNSGAQDYLVKGQVDHSLLFRSVRYGIERKHVERKLRQSDAFYQSLVENLPQNIIRKDVNGRFTFANQRFCAELGVRPEEIIGKTDFDFFEPAMAAKYQEDDRKVMHSGEIYDAVEEHASAGRDSNYVQVVKTPIYDDTGQIIGTQIIFWDVTEKRRSEENLRQAHNELARSREDLLQAVENLKQSNQELKNTQLQMMEMEKMQTLGQLAAGVAHEVKNPLAILRMGVEYLQNAPGGKEGAPGEICRDMSDAIERADSIIMGMLDFSAHRQIDMQPLDLNGLLADTLRLVQHQFKSSDYAIEQDFDEQLPNGLGDSNKLKQVFVNLFTNAAHAMPEGGTLTIATHPSETKRLAEEVQEGGSRDMIFHQAGERDLVVEVADTGTGIPEDKLKRVFEPFFTTKSAGVGTGLGLSVTRKIIELHHGRLEVENRPIKGVLVRVTLLSERQAL